MSVLTWEGCSGVVCGLILDKKYSLNVVRPEMFTPPYSDIIKALKGGITEPEELIEILDEYVQKDTRIQLFRNETNLGLAKSLNMLGDGELQILGERGKEKKEELEENEIEKLHSKHGVRSGKGPDRKAEA